MLLIGFDLDGTVLDTLADIAGACNVILGRHGYPQHPISAYARMVGNGFAILMKRALPPERMPDACRVEELTQEARAYYGEHMRERTRPYPGVAEALATLKRQGLALAVLSNKPDVMTVELIRHFFPGVFEAIQGARPDAPLKPDPAALLRIADGLGAELAAYVGDSDVDMQTAHGAGAMAVGCAWGFRGVEELKASGADAVLWQPGQIADLGALAAGRRHAN